MAKEEKLPEDLDIPEEGVEEKKTSPTVSFSIILAILVLVGTFLTYWLGVAKSSKLKTLESQLADLGSQLSAKEMKEAETKLNNLASQLSGLQKALREKTVWSKLFSELQSVTPKDVRYTNFSLAEDGTVSLSGETNSYTSLAKFLVAMKGSDKFTDLKLSSSALQKKEQETKLTFAVSLKVKTATLTEKPATTAPTPAQTPTENTTTPATSPEGVQP